LVRDEQQNSDDLPRQARDKHSDQQDVPPEKLRKTAGQKGRKTVLKERSLHVCHGACQGIGPREDCSAAKLALCHAAMPNQDKTRQDKTKNAAVFVSPFELRFLPPFRWIGMQTKACLGDASSRRGFKSRKNKSRK
jgi:hypothetical protein